MLNRIKHFLTGDVDPVDWKDIPTCLRKKMGIWIFLGGAVLLVDLLIFGYFNNVGMMQTGLVLGCVMFAIAAYFYFVCRYKKYAVFSGVIRGVHKTGLFWKNTTIVLDCGEECIQFVVREQLGLFREGLPVTIYIPDHAQRSKTIGELAFHEYLAIEPHRTK